MSMDFPTARRVSVATGRLPGWIERFESRHGTVTSTILPGAIFLQAADGARARLINRWEPLDPATSLPDALAQLVRPRRVAVLLVRKAASAVGVADGDELIVHRTSRHYVQSRTKAGGWSQQRYARRRANQTRFAYQQAADDAAEVLLPRLDGCEALITGGDKTAVADVLADPRLSGLARLPHGVPLLAVPDARLNVLAEAVRQARSIPIDLDATAIADAGPDRPAADSAE
ncbi:MAG: hypothetical protein KDB34_03595 [Propionibacteriaceae bacterium]|nr:hypothetical protein [Propionibacteriaceae bacterium]